MPMDRRMLDYLGLQDVELLFDDIPEDVRMERLDLPDGMSEPETVRTIREMLRPNVTADDMPSFLGGGVYNHFIPATVRSIISRSELITSYTPYQSEISQGMLADPVRVPEHDVQAHRDGGGQLLQLRLPRPP